MASLDSKRAQFGGRLLNDQRDVFEHNAWDNVAWDEEQLFLAEQKIKENSADKLESDRIQELDSNANSYWNSFYQKHQDKFFKDRHWLFTEFPELLSNCSEGKQKIAFERQPNRSSTSVEVKDVGKDEISVFCHKDDQEDKITSSIKTTDDRLVLWEIGCGVGNTIMSILDVNTSSNTVAFCSDFSDVAIDILKKRCEDESRCRPFVFDATANQYEYQLPFPEQSLDMILMIFTLSALSPEKMQMTINNAVRYLRPGGCFLFRDYGRYDLAQVRFKKGHCLSNNFYVRSDGTRAYFFTEEELERLFTTAGLQRSWVYVDRRLQVNRGKQLKMYRVWIQAKYFKPQSL